MVQHYDHEWILILAAYLYELYPDGDMLCSDAAYDMYKLNPLNTIPGFTPDTGLWVHELIKNEEYHSVIKSAIAKLKTYSNYEGTCIINLIPKDFILDYT